ncbi:MAG TPA: N-acyl homoserine lactonase family protein [Bryobacteraceae bacterium]|jgi:glyoxylase-like metal-dependent hydrolase (beta-lactamase superfamily II)|nr:N-acyl homoserine lactonase family protein [Bryobacteraceae bacterium]
MKRIALFFLLAAFLDAGIAAAQTKPKPPKTPRLYVIDCGLLTMSGPQLFGFTKEEIGEKQPFAVPCYLIVHPKGTLLWDTGVIPDAQVPTTQGISTVTKTLKSSLAEIGYTPKDITYLGLSHMHSDHTANANDYAGSTWLVHQAERDAMFAPPPPPGPGRGRGGPVQSNFFDKLKDAKTTILTDKDYDVFGDGTVVIKYAPGHTPGHQVLFVKLKESGPILIAGDLYHLPQEITMHRFPSFEFDKEQSAVSREKIEAFLKQSGARLWIEHDLATFALLKKSPAYYE